VDRRTFVSGSLAILAAPLVAEGQQPGKVARLGLLGLFTPELGAALPLSAKGWASWVGAKART